ncbi:MAG: 2-isopropylmalate synthase [Tindallia sp. MSAO_Bac2]|nr:MAG: 2-isopropylmalate synthase [Tindallia sp. MSAO_Bac2]
MSESHIKIFDTTLRDGEQSPGCSMNLKEKLEMAKQLEKLRVDVIEAGFAIASPGDFEAVKAVAETVKEVRVASLARTLPQDIDRAYEAVKNAEAPIIHTFIATSDIHMQYKLKSTPDQVLERAVEMVRHAKSYLEDVQFSAEDATRSQPEFLYRIFEAVIQAGAKVINVPDTVGYTTPDEFAALIKGIKENVPSIDKATIAVHCHNDLGMAVANTLAAAKAGATQLECTVNGIGERAGNAAMEEIVMALQTRYDFYQNKTNVVTQQLYPASRLLSQVTGMKVQRNKAIVGENAFAHESGIHQHGVLANKSTYEIMTPESVGLHQNQLVLGKHSGRHAFEDRMKSMGYDLDRPTLDKVFQSFKELADKKKVVYNKDLEALIKDKTLKMEEYFQLQQFVINCGNFMTSTATLKLRNFDKELEAVSTGSGPIYAAFGAIDQLVGKEYKLDDYSLQAVTEGEDAQGEAFVQIRKGDELYHGSGISTDVIEASIKAYINAINRMLSNEEKQDF